MKLSILYFIVLLVILFSNGVFLCWKIVFIFANSADPDEMPPFAASHLGRPCLLKYLFAVIQSERVNKQEYYNI